MSAERLPVLKATAEIVRGLPFADYLAIPALSSSGAKHLLRSPAHYRDAMDNPKPPTAAMRIGTSVHIGALESDQFDARVACAPVCDKRTKVGKELFAEFESTTNEDTLIFSSDDYIRVLGTVQAVRAHKAAAAVIDGAEVELTIIWTDERWGIQRKARLDIVNGGLVADLKTCQDASRDAFRREVEKYKYFVQAAMYVDAYTAAFGTEPEAYLLIAAETDRPHQVAVYPLDWGAIDAGRALLDVAMERYRDCLQSSRWPGYGDLIAEPLTLSSWAMKGIV